MTYKDNITAILECYFAGFKKELIDSACNRILEQEPKTGHWIIYKDCEGKTRECTCDQCGYKTGKYTWHNPDFCAGCGAKMVEPQERSEE